MHSITRLAVVLVVAASLLLPRAMAHAARPHLVLGIPALRQRHHLTCESAAASMATRGAVAESQLMATMPRHRNPNIGFRGNPDGFQGTSLVDYGVYAGPVHNALLRYGYASDVLAYGTDRQLQGYIDRGWPVVAWVTYALQSAKPRIGQAAGVQFVLVPHEHAITVVGYDAQTVLANDPWDGKQVRYYWRDFNRGWGYFGNMALAVDPCPPAQPVGAIGAATASDGSVTWSWKAALNAAHYGVLVIRHGQRDRTVFQGIQDARSFTLASVKPGPVYEIAVTAISACGEQASTTRWYFQVPATVNPTPTSAPEGTVAPTATTTATPVATATGATPLATATSQAVTPRATATATKTPAPHA